MVQKIQKRKILEGDNNKMKIISLFFEDLIFKAKLMIEFQLFWSSLPKQYGLVERQKQAICKQNAYANIHLIEHPLKIPLEIHELLRLYIRKNDQNCFQDKLE